MRSASGVLATFFGLGLAPFAPGTVASAAAAVLFKLVLHDLSWPLYGSLLVVLFFVGAAVSAVHASELNHPDPGRIVIDEVCGQLVALAFLPPGWLQAGISFALFRFFDIIKPWPIRKLEKLPAGWGIMADDVGAGLAAAAVARLLLLLV